MVAKNRHSPRRMALLLTACFLVGILILPGMAHAQDGSMGGVPTEGTDVGDAPTSFNRSGVIMTAYPAGGPPGVLAKFPVVASLPAPASPDGYGLCHSALSPSFLGPAPLPSKSGEADADQAPDVDGPTNIDPLTDTANRDGHDDGVAFPASFPHCSAVTIFVEGWVGLVAQVPEYYIEAWFDWNRDGDWNDGQACGCGSDEWAVQDWPVTPDAVTGHFSASIPIVPCHPGSETDPLWVRVTLSAEEFFPLGAQWWAGGKPSPLLCLVDGETEDYYLEPEPTVEFVPEPGSLLLLGSGLAGLAGYVTLRWRVRE